MFLESNEICGPDWALFGHLFSQETKRNPVHSRSFSVCVCVCVYQDGLTIKQG